MENAMRELRHQEVRQSANAVVKGAKAYMALVRANLLKEVKREDLVVDAVVSVSADSVRDDSMYNCNRDPEGRGKFKGIMQDKARWRTWDAQSYKQQSVVDSLVRDLHAKDKPELAMEAWRSAVVPVGKFVAQLRNYA